MLDAKFWLEALALADPWLYRTAAIVTIVGAVVWLMNFLKARSSDHETVAVAESLPRTIRTADHDSHNRNGLIFPCTVIGCVAILAALFGVTAAWASQWIPDMSATQAAIVVSGLVAVIAGIFTGQLSQFMWRLTIPMRVKVALMLTATVYAAAMGTLITPTEYLYSNAGDVMEAGIPLLAGVVAFVIGRRMP